MDDGNEAVGIMPKEIATAKTAVMKATGKLAKDNNNKFDKYKFASVDDFYAFVRDHMAENGLGINQRERNAELKEMKKKNGDPLLMWWAKYDFNWEHVTGAVYYAGSMSVMVQANGAQASGSAQSYAQKQFLRREFLIPTGEDDADTKQTAEMQQSTSTGNNLQKQATDIRNKMRKINDENELANYWEEQDLAVQEIRQASEKAYKALDEEYEKNMTRIKQQQ